MMGRWFAALLVVGALALSALPAQAAVRTPYLVFDPISGKVIIQRDPHQAWYPASLTKLMTVYITFRELDAARLSMRSPVKISQNALNEPPSKMGYKVGTVITVENALRILLVKSANDIAVALGESIAGSESAFVERMNQEARRLGMTRTHFVNPNGLPADGQVTTARDMGVLAQALWMEFPNRREMFRIEAIRAGKRVLRNYNTLLERYPGANGMKTGFICAAGFNLVASATRDGETLIAIVFGARTSGERAEQTARLLNRGFSNWAAGFMAPTIDSMVGSGRSEPVNMRPYVCEARKDDTSEGDEDEPPSVLGPRVQYMEPIRVYTGGADPSKPVLAEGIPVPRPRPPTAAIEEDLRSSVN